MPSDFTSSLLAGGFAGFAVDISLFPLDTIKTRMQSAEGFLKSGAFRGVYSGLGPAALGSFPGAAMFFATYDTSKKYLQGSTGGKERVWTHLGAASLGEVAACLVRVPTENLKQNLQTNRFPTLKLAFGALKDKGLGAFYRGYASTLMREIPFSCIQFPLWEAGKRLCTKQGEKECAPGPSAVLGSLSGALAAGLTTPLDVVKTRLMTSPDRYFGVWQTFSLVYREEGPKALLRGIEPRVMWIGIGGFVFFGAYEAAKQQLTI
ncbi:hypothetical protein BASA81_007531 [Batrachochytrium salamandrivorans]|nr:hypothetical protein BASA81_007531 [Batrachochytrium salamandrivorans]